jgi:hypothetical protein
VLNRRPLVANLLSSVSGLRSQTGRLVSGLGLISMSPQVADAARKSERRGDNQARNNDDSGDNQDDRQEPSQNEQEAERKNDDGARSEDLETSDESRNAEKGNRDDRHQEDDVSSEQGGSDGGKTRGDSSRRDGDSDSNSRDDSSADNDSDQGGRRVRELEQEVDEPLEDVPVEDVPAPTTITPGNPNVFVEDIPTTSIADLVVEANDDVIATVSTSGGFAFARSGDVIAVTGPDGASIIQTGDVNAGTRGTPPEEPSDDGGDNDMDFLS